MERWSFFVWYPPGHLWCEPLAWEPGGWTSLLCCINNRVRATPLHGQRRLGMAGEQVVHKGGLVMDFGLFPVSDTAALVLVELLRIPSGYRSWHLLAWELGDLWDVSILFLDSLQDLEVAPLMAALCLLPPSKLLHMGADVLLITGFRGGGWRGGRGSVLGIIQAHIRCRTRTWV